MTDPVWPQGRLPARAIVIAAHPDDEVIGAGVLLARLQEARVLHVTDGAPRNERDAHAGGFAGWAEYAAARHREAEDALALAGIGADRVHGLGIPDQQATTEIVDVAKRLAEFLAAGTFDCVITHAYEGGHPDHDAVACAAHAASRILERAGQRRPALVEMALYHGLGNAFVAGTFIALWEAEPVASFALDPEARDLKRRMLACHRSQRAVLAPFGVEIERFRRAPGYDFRLPPHPGTLNYERHDWGMTGERWRALARAALEELGLANPSRRR
jgi:N-acetylglucosamine malate deacetylase 2